MKKILGVAVVLLVGLGALDYFDLPSRVPKLVTQYLTGRDAPASALRSPEHATRKLRTWPAGDVAVGEAAAGLLRVVPDAASRASGFERALVAIGAERRLALGGALPHAGAATLELPAGAPRLRFAIDHAEAGLDGEVVYEIRIRPDSGDSGDPAQDEAAATLIFSASRPVHATGWHDHSVDLSRWAGQRVRLEFAARFDAGRDARVPKAFWGSVAIRSKPQTPHPNLVVILLDTLRADHLGTYGYERDTSPFMDSLAEQGVRFDRALSTAPWTDPSILSLMTGLYPSDVWEPGGTRRSFGARSVPAEVESFPETLAAAGYETIAIVDHPALTAQRFGQGFDTYRMLNSGRGATVTTPPREVLRSVESLLEGSGDGVFLYLHLLYPHLPYEAPAGYHGMFGPGEREEDRANRDGLVNLYDAQIRLSDDVVSALMALFERMGLADDLVVAIVADHGESFWDHELFAHGNSLYNELLHVPLIFYGPGRVPEGRSVGDVVQTIDLGPTLLDLAGVPIPDGKRGASLVDAMNGGDVPRRVALSEFAYRRIPHGRALQTDDAKLILDEPGAAAKRFDLGVDPGELEADARLAEDTGSLLVEGLAALVESTEKRRASVGEVGIEKVSPEAAEQLRALGYTE